MGYEFFLKHVTWTLRQSVKLGLRFQAPVPWCDSDAFCLDFPWQVHQKCLVFVPMAHANLKIDSGYVQIAIEHDHL